MDVYLGPNTDFNTRIKNNAEARKLFESDLKKLFSAYFPPAFYMLRQFSVYSVCFPHTLHVFRIFPALFLHISCEFSICSAYFPYVSACFLFSVCCLFSAYFPHAMPIFRIFPASFLHIPPIFSMLRQISIYSGYFSVCFASFPHIFRIFSAHLPPEFCILSAFCIFPVCSAYIPHIFHMLRQFSDNGTHGSSPRKFQSR